jgi:hypothetical protein
MNKKTVADVLNNFLDETGRDATHLAIDLGDMDIGNVRNILAGRRGVGLKFYGQFKLAYLQDHEVHCVALLNAILRKHLGIAE